MKIKTTDKICILESNSKMSYGKNEIVTKSPARALHLDLLRLFAYFFVIVNHSNNAPLDSLGRLYYLGRYYIYFCLLNTPLFAMISGALLLKKEEPYKKVFQRLIRLIVTLLLFSFLNYAMGGGDISATSLFSFFVSLWSAPQPFAFWYLYMYAGFIVMLPLLRKLVINMQRIDFAYYLFIFALVGTIPYIAMYLHLPAISPFFEIPLFTFPDTAGAYLFLGFFILGYFMEHVFDPSYYKIKGILVSIPLFLLSQCLYVLKEFIYNSGLVDVNPAVSNLALPNFISLLALWYTAATICYHVKLGSVVSFVISAAAKATFGAYLIHIIVISKFPNVYPTVFSWIPHPMVAVIATEIVYALIAITISILLGFIPGIRKLTASELPKWYAFKSTVP